PRSRRASRRPVPRPARSRSPARARSSVVLELQLDDLVEPAQPGDDPLQVVFRLSGYADGVALDLGLDLRELISDELRDLLRELVREATPQLDPLADLAPAGRFDLAPVEDLERQAPPDRLRLDEILHGGGAILVV